MGKKEICEDHIFCLRILKKTRECCKLKKCFPAVSLLPITVLEIISLEWLRFICTLVKKLTCD
jgi:hypothetical protein